MPRGVGQYSGRVPGSRNPPPSSEDVSSRMRRVRTRDTEPEVALRRILHARGLRYRVDVRPEPWLRRRADVVFRREKLAIFVDGCFWHRCPDHGTDPAANGGWWREKLDANVSRDRDTDCRLSEAGWTVVRIWEHEQPAVAADRVMEELRTLRAR